MPLDVRPEVKETPFGVDVAGRHVPGVLWTPTTADGPLPLVLIGHGATRHKRIDYVLALARRLVRNYSVAAMAIDGPGHGDRRSIAADEMTVFGEFLSEWSRPTSVDEMVADWQAALSAVRDLAPVGQCPMGYWGLSMGTIYGIPLAAMDPKIRVGVFGLMGLVGPTRERLARDAVNLDCPVLFIQQWNDSLITRTSSFELFDAIGSPNKRLHSHPGDHSEVPPEELAFSAAFLAEHLAS